MFLPVTVSDILFSRPNLHGGIKAGSRSVFDFVLYIRVRTLSVSNGWVTGEE
jgi:hypothetical protein